MLIGREEERKNLQRAFESAEAEFVVVYGRRRIGKTFLIREFFKLKPCLFFQSIGLQKGALADQLKHFADALSETFMQNIPIKMPESWEEAFSILTRFIATVKNEERTVIFLDELPWMATKRSKLLESLSYYWNRYWSTNNKILLIVCGSSASWLIKNIIYNKGGLHNRCTKEIKLSPFTLSETEDYLFSRNIKLTRRQILELYMTVGGVPYYLKYIVKGVSTSENIQQLFFDEKSPLKEEFYKLFRSLFSDAEAYIELIKLIAQKKGGVSRSYLEKHSKLSQGGGRLTQRLLHLVQTDFIADFLPWGSGRGEFYKIIDEFSLFFISWMEKVKSYVSVENYWLLQSKKPAYHVWLGYAFEAVCFKHARKIVSGLNIKLAETIAAWRFSTNKQGDEGAQIDMLIDRGDDAITVCEIKYTNEPFVITKKYASDLIKKLEIFKTKTKTKKQLFLALISANGVKNNYYFDEVIDSSLTLDGFFD